MPSARENLNEILKAIQPRTTETRPAERQNQSEERARTTETKRTEVPDDARQATALNKFEFEDIFKQPQEDLTTLLRSSAGWFEAQARALSEMTSGHQAVNSGYFQIDYMAIPGNMILFKYFPKHNEKLDYWDVYPLVIPFGQIKQGFIGINFHYLGYYERLRLFRSLSGLANTSNLSRRTKLNLTWGSIQTAAGSAVQNAIHCYLYSQMRSPIRHIHPKDWITALTLPWESFQQR